MKILYISDTFPQFHAPGGAPTKFYCQLREVAKKHRISLLTTKWKGVKIGLEELKHICEDVFFYDFIDNKDKKESSLDKLIGLKNKKRLDELKSLFFQHDSSDLKRYEAFKNKLEDIDLTKFDLIQFESSDIAFRALEIKKSLPKMPLVLELFDVGSLIRYRVFKYAKTFRWKIYCYLRWKKSINYEKRMFSLFDKVLCVSKDDRKLALSLNPNIKAEIIPNGVDTDFFNLNNIFIEPYSLNFVGSNWHPNVDGAIYFFQNIWNKIKADMPNAKVYIIGSVGDNKELKKFHNGKDIIVTGRVKDVREYMAKTEVSIVPLRLGGGTRVKILEAMSMKKPVVSTSMGSEGLETKHDENILRADSPKDFAYEVSRVLKDKKLREKLSSNGRKFVEENYGWRIIGRKLNKIYEDLMRK